MGATKQHFLEESDRRYRQNRYSRKAAQVRNTMALYADRPSFVAKLKRELEDLKKARKAELAAEKEQRSK